MNRNHPRFIEFAIQPHLEAPRKGHDHSASLSDIKSAMTHVARIIEEQAGNELPQLVSDLVHGFGLSSTKAFPILVPWIERCEPSWSAQELARRLNEAERERMSKGPEGNHEDS